MDDGKIEIEISRQGKIKSIIDDPDQGVLRITIGKSIVGSKSIWNLLLTRYTVHGRGAKSPLGSNYQVTTILKKLKVLSKKCPKSGPKSGPNTVRFPTVFRKVACF